MAVGLIILMAAGNNNNDGGPNLVDERNSFSVCYEWSEPNAVFWINRTHTHLQFHFNITPYTFPISALSRVVLTLSSQCLVFHLRFHPNTQRQGRVVHSFIRLPAYWLIRRLFCLSVYTRLPTVHTNQTTAYTYLAIA